MQDEAFLGGRQLGEWSQKHNNYQNSCLKNLKNEISGPYRVSFREAFIIDP